jgi:hypothetical protein
MSEKIISKQEQVSKRVYEFYKNNKKVAKKSTHDHFAAENFPKSIIFRIIQRAENEYVHEKIRESGRKPQIMTKRQYQEAQRHV